MYSTPTKPHILIEWAIGLSIACLLGGCIPLDIFAPELTATPTAIDASNLSLLLTEQIYMRSASTVGGVNSLVWSPDGTQIASGHNRIVQIWDVYSGTPISAMHGHSGMVSSVDWSPDGALIASGGFDNTVQVWDASSGALLNTITGNFNRVTSVAWSPDGTQLATGGLDRAVHIWDANGVLQSVFETPHPTDAVVAWSSDGTRLAAGDGDNNVWLWDVDSDTSLATFGDVETLSMWWGGHLHHVSEVVWSPDDTKIATGTQEGTVLVWDVASEGLLYTLTGHTDVVESVAWSPDGMWLASSGRDGNIRVWDVDSGTLAGIAEGHVGSVQSVAWSPDSMVFASGGSDGIRIWHITGD